MIEQKRDERDDIALFVNRTGNCQQRKLGKMNSTFMQLGIGFLQDTPRRWESLAWRLFASS